MIKRVQGLIFVTCCARSNDGLLFYCNASRAVVFRYVLSLITSLLRWQMNKRIKAFYAKGKKKKYATLVKKKTLQIMKKKFTEPGDHDFCLSRSHYTDTDPISREWERASNPQPPYQKSRALPTEPPHLPTLMRLKHNRRNIRIFSQLINGTSFSKLSQGSLSQGLGILHQAQNTSASQIRFDRTSVLTSFAP